MVSPDNPDPNGSPAGTNADPGYGTNVLLAGHTVVVVGYGSVVISWNGNCYVHHQITPANILAVKDKMPNVKVLVHPECRSDVIALADAFTVAAHDHTLIFLCTTGDSYGALGARNFVEMHQTDDLYAVITLRDITSPLTGWLAFAAGSAVDR